MIAVLVPVLNRPERAAPFLASLKEHSTDLVTRVLFIASRSDQREMRALVDALSNASMNGSSATTVNWEPGPGDFAMKNNWGHARSDEPYVFLAADDLLFHPGWDEAALRVAEDTGAGVIGTNDLANPAVKAGKHATHSLVRRSYIDEVGGTFDQGPGVVLYEGYDHQSVDNELVTAAKRRLQWAFARDSHVQHLHPMYDRTVKMDSTYERGLAKGKQDRMLFSRRLVEFQRHS